MPPVWKSGRTVDTVTVIGWVPIIGKPHVYLMGGAVIGPGAAYAGPVASATTPTVEVTAAVARDKALRLMDDLLRFTCYLS
ncbi:hypothetical protein GCM10027589_31320 [Actinocorallia lasiicapitis]